MALHIETWLAYDYTEPTDLLLQIEAAKVPGQRVIEHGIGISPVEHFARMPGHDEIGERIWLRVGPGELRIDYHATVEIDRPVADVAALLGALTGEDARDTATARSKGHVEADYTKFLDVAALKGARIGVARNLAGFHPAVDAAFNLAIKALTAAGAVVVDPVTVPNLGKFDDAEMEVLLYEFKDGLNKYLAERGSTVTHTTLADLIAYNTKEAATEMPHFAQELFERAEKKGPLSDAAYKNALATCRKLVRTEGLDKVFAEHKLDALVAPSNGPAWPTDHVNGDRFTGGNTSYAAVAGYPSITVPMGYASELPLGLSFLGLAWTEGRLIGLAHSFEAATTARHSPKFLPTVPIT